MRGDGEPVANSVASRLFEDQPVARRQVDHLWKLRPGEANAGQVAGPMDGIGEPELLLVEIFDPLQGIIVQPDCRLRRLAKVDMMGEREIVKAHLATDFFEQTRQLGLGNDSSDLTYKRLDPAEQPRRGAPRAPLGRAFQAADAQSPPLCAVAPGLNRRGRQSKPSPSNASANRWSQAYPPNKGIINRGPCTPRQLGAWQGYPAYA